MRRILITIAAVALVSAACSSSGTDTTTTTAVGGNASTGTTAAGSAETTTTTSSAASDATTTTASAGSGGGGLEDCIVGTWELDAQAFFDLITESLDDSEAPGEFLHLGGVNQITAAADGSFTDERIDWRFGVMSEFGALEMTVNHTQTGTWSVDADVVSTVITDNGGGPEYTMAVDGVPFTFPGGGAPIDPPDTSFDAAAVDCGPTTLSVTVEEVTSTWTRTG